MGVNSLWKVRIVIYMTIDHFSLLNISLQLISSAGEKRNLRQLALSEPYAQAQPLRLPKIGIDASASLAHLMPNSNNPELEFLLIQCFDLLREPVIPVFVFDGPLCTLSSMANRISPSHPWTIDSMKDVIAAFGFVVYTVNVIYEGFNRC